MLAGRYDMPSEVSIVDMAEPHLYPPMLALPVCPHPRRSLPLESHVRSFMNFSLVKRHATATEWNGAQRLLGPKLELPS